LINSDLDAAGNAYQLTTTLSESIPTSIGLAGTGLTAGGDLGLGVISAGASTGSSVMNSMK
jgi:hypothetical protein